MESVCVPISNISGQGRIPHFGWALCQNAQKQLRDGDFRRWFCCLGVCKCTKCDFVAKPLLPQSRAKKFGNPPLPPRHTCVVHSSKPLQWIGCTGGENDGPCKTIVTCCGGKSSDKIEFKHIGKHDHPKPPMKKPSPASLRQLQKTVVQNPDIKPSKLHMGHGTEKPVSDMDEAFCNKDHVGYCRHQILNKKHGPQGIRGSMAALMQLAQDLPEKFFHIDMGNPAKKIKPVIHMQSKFMRDILNGEHLSTSFQSDTIEGVVHDLEHLDGQISIHFTSAFDPVLQRWVPVLMSILFGRSAEDHCDHWTQLLQSFSSTSWDEFQEKFPGITVDWSEAERKGHVKAFLELARARFHVEGFTENDACTCLRKCDVHFKRSRQRVMQNGSIVAPEKKALFRKHTDILIDDDTSQAEFCHSVNFLEKEFPDALPWLNWHLDPRRARSYFPVCAGSDWQSRNMSKTTNAQENLGGQFQHLFGKKMTLNEAVLNLWKFVNRFDMDHQASLRGLSNKCSQCPRLTPKKRKHKRQKNDGRGPDTTDTLKAAKKARPNRRQKKLIQQNLSHLLSRESHQSSINSFDLDLNKFHGIQWGFHHQGVLHSNTCPLDSFLSLMHMIHKGKLMVNPLAEVLDDKSLLARAFKELDENDTLTGGINARMVFINDFCKADWVNQHGGNLHSDLDIFFHKTRTHVQTKRSPVFQSATWEYTRSSWSCTLGEDCRRPSGPVRAAPTGKTKRMIRFTKTTEEGVDDTGEDLMKQTIDEQFEAKEVHQHACTVDYIETGELTEDGKPKKDSIVTCPGHRMIQKASIKKIPQLAVFDQGEAAVGALTFGGISHLADVPFEFCHLERRWVLRGAILGDGCHFTAVARLPNGWMHYDGMGSPMLKFYPLNRKGATKAMHGRGIAHVCCEVLELHETRNFGEEKLDHSTVFHFETKKKQKEPDKEDEDKVKIKSRHLVTAKKKKRPLKKMTLEESSDEDSDQEEEDKVKMKSRHLVTAKKKKSPLKKTTLEDSSDEDSDQEEEDKVKMKSRHLVTAKKKKSPLKKTTLEDSSDEDSDQEEEDKVKMKSRHLVTAKKKKSPLKKTTLEDSSDEDSDQEEEDNVKMKSRHLVTAKKKKSPLKKTTLEDSSDEELKFTDTDENEEILDWASDEETQLKKTMKLKKTKARIPPGWSVRPEGSGTRGPLPRCKGCKGKINRDSKCIRLKKYKSSFSHVHQDVWQCHCRVDCLARAERSELKKLTQKHWTDQRVATVVGKLDKKLGLSP